MNIKGRVILRRQIRNTSYQSKKERRRSVSCIKGEGFVYERHVVKEETGI